MAIQGYRALKLDFNYKVKHSISIDLPVFEVTPAVIIATDCKPNKTYTFSVEFRNQDQHSRYLRVTHQESPYFRLFEKSPSSEKIASGLSKTVTLQFKPCEKKDYTHELVCNAEREAFSVPILCIGSSASVEAPSRISFSKCLVKEELEKVVSLRNKSISTAVEFKAQAFGAFSVYPLQGVFLPNEPFLILIKFTPQSIGMCDGGVYFEVENSAGVYIPVTGEAFEGNVTLSTDRVLMNEIYIGTRCYVSMLLENHTDHFLKYSWLQNPQSKQICGESNDAEILSLNDGVFTMEPASGSLLPQSNREIRIAFSPQIAQSYSTTAFCNVSGKVEALVLAVHGRARGPLVDFSFRTLDVGSVFVTATHTYELVLANRGQIGALFSVKHIHSDWATCFSFTPNEGLINPKEYQAIQVTLCASQKLGAFCEAFEFVFDGCLDTQAVTFKGEIVGPTMHFDVSKLNLGLVSHGFPLERKLTLFNKSLISVDFNLQTRAHGESGFEDIQLTSLDESPLMPLSSTVVTLRLTPIQLGILKIDLVVDVLDIDFNLVLPIEAECCVPKIVAELYSLDIGRCFIRHPQPFTIRLLNDSTIPARYAFLDPVIEGECRTPIVHFKAAVPRGLLPPSCTTELLMEAFVFACETIVERIQIEILGSETTLLELMVTCHGQGPVINIIPISLDWGSIPTLSTTSRCINLFNESPITAVISTNMLDKKTIFRVKPTICSIAPFGQIEMEILARPNDSITFNDVLVVCVAQSLFQYKVDLSVKGRGSTIVFQPPLTSTLNVGQNFDIAPLRRVFNVRNSGRRQQRLIWSIEDLVKTKNDCLLSEAEIGKKSTNEDDACEITIKPSRFELKSFESTDIVIEANSTKPQKLACIIKCHSIVDRKGSKKLIKKVSFSVEFISPIIEITPKIIVFKVEKTPMDVLTIQNQLICLENTSELCLQFGLDIEHPFSLLFKSETVQRLESRLSSKEAETFAIQFDPSFKDDLESRTIENCLTISFKEHPMIKNIPIRGEVYFPNLHISTKEVNFGCILNQTESTYLVMMHNTSPLEVAYNWSFLIGDRPHLSFNRRPITIELQSPSPSWLPPVRSNLSAGERKSEVNDEPIGERAYTLSAINANPEENTVLQSLLSIDRVILPLGIEEVFDITPLSGIIKPGEIQPTSFSFFGHPNISAKVCALCEVDGGPRYRVEVSGEASEIECCIDCSTVDFEDLIYQQNTIKIIKLTNSGKIDCDFLIDGRYEFLQFSPRSGTVSAKGIQEIEVIAFPIKPEQFDVVVDVVIDKLAPSKLTIRGSVSFPHILLTLPRPIVEEHHPADNEVLGLHHSFYEEYRETGLCKPEDLSSAERRYICTCIDDMEIEKSSPNEIRKNKFFLPQYELDFGQTLIGAVYEHSIRVINVGHFPAQISLDQVSQRALHKLGFSICALSGNDGKNIKSLELLPNNNTDLQVIFDPRGARLDAGPVDFTVQLKVVHSPYLPIRIRTNVVVPNLIPSVDLIDFGEVIVGEAKVISVQLYNPCPVSVVWRHCLAGEDSVGSSLPTNFPQHRLRSLAGNKNEIKQFPHMVPVVEMLPKDGVLVSGERANVNIKFCPPFARSFIENLTLQLADSFLTPCISCRGSSVEPRLTFQPASLQFEPILPVVGETSQILTVSNPCNFPIEFYSLQFDPDYKEEDKMLNCLTEYDANKSLLMPLRKPDEKLPKEILEFVESMVQKQKEELETSSLNTKRGGGKASRRQLKSQTKQLLPTVESSERGDFENDMTPAVSKIGQTKPVAMALGSYLGINMQEARHDVVSTFGIVILVLGSPLAGKTRMSQKLAAKYEAALISVDEVILKALKFDRGSAASLARQQCRQQIDPETTKQRASITKSEIAGVSRNAAFTNKSSRVKTAHTPVIPAPALQRLVPEGLLISEGGEKEGESYCITCLSEPVLEDLLRERFAEPDCRLGIIIDGLTSKFCSSSVTLCNVLLKAIGKRRNLYAVSILRDLASVQAGDVAFESAMHQKEKQDVQKRLAAVLEMTESEYDALSQSVKDSVELTVSEARLAKRMQQAEELKQRAADAEAEANAKLELERNAKRKHKKLESKAAFDRTTSRIELSVVNEGMDSTTLIKKRYSVDTKMDVPNHIDASYLDLDKCFKSFDTEFQVICTLLSTWDRQRDQSTNFTEMSSVANRRISKNRIVLNSSNENVDGLIPSANRLTPTEYLSSASSSGLLPWRMFNTEGRPNQSVFASPLPIGVPHVIYQSSLQTVDEEVIVPRGELGEVITPQTDLNPLFDELDVLLPSQVDVLNTMGLGSHGMPIPQPVVFSVVYKPSTRPNEVEISRCFSIGPPMEDGLGAIPKVNSTEINTAIGKSETSSARAHRTSNASMHLRSISGYLQTPSNAEVNPKRYRWILPPKESIQMMVNCKSESVGVLQSLLTFEIMGSRRRYNVQCKGLCQIPNLCSDPKLVFPQHVKMLTPTESTQKRYILNEDYFEFGPLLIAKTKERIKASEFPENGVKLAMVNNSSIEVNAAVYFLNPVNDSNDEVKEHQEAFFAVTPNTLQIKAGEKRSLKLWAFPRTPGRFVDSLVVCIQNNPQPLVFHLACDGVLPKLDLDTNSIIFEKVLLHRKCVQRLTLTNPTCLPVAWKINGMEQLGEEFSILPESGVVNPKSEFSVQIFFRALRASKISQKKSLRLEVFDVDNIAGLVQVENIQVQAEAYDFLLDLVFPKSSVVNGLDFGTMKTGEEARQSIVVRNKGAHEFSYKFVFQTKKKGFVDLSKIFSVSLSQGQVSATDRSFSVQVVCKSNKEITLINENVFSFDVYDPNNIVNGSQDLVASIPTPISVQIAFSQFRITPAKEISFGSILTPSKTTQHFILENKGPFDFRYSIMSMTKIKEMRALLGGVAQRSLKNRMGDVSYYRTFSARLQLGPFSISPAVGTVTMGSSQKVTIDCAIDTTGKFEEILCLDVSDSRPVGSADFGVPYRLFVEGCLPGLETADLDSVFEEHRICRSFNGLMDIPIDDISGGAFIEAENRFVFTNILVGSKAQARFKISNPSKIPAEVRFSVRLPVEPRLKDAKGMGTAKTEQRFIASGGTFSDVTSRTTGLQEVESGVFEIHPSKAVIPPHAAVYVSCLFSPQEMQTYSACFEAVLVNGSMNQPIDTSSLSSKQNPNNILQSSRPQPHMKTQSVNFMLWGEGQLPRMSIIRPSTRNLRGILTCVFPIHRQKCTSDFEGQRIVLQNTGKLLCKLNVDLWDPSGTFSIAIAEGNDEENLRTQGEIIYLCETRKGIDLEAEAWRKHKEMREWACLSGRSHTGAFQFRPDERLHLIAYFHPPHSTNAGGQTHFLATLKLSVVNNDYDGAVVELVGETKMMSTDGDVPGPIMLVDVPRLERGRAEAIQSVIEAALLLKSTQKEGENKGALPSLELNLETKLPSLGDQSVWMRELSYTAIDELLDNHLDFGDCGIGEEVRHSFILKYAAFRDALKEDSGISFASGSEGNDEDDASLPVEFNWPINHPQFTFEPANGQLVPGQSVSIKASFCSQSVPFRCRFAPITCRLGQVQLSQASPIAGIESDTAIFDALNSKSETSKESDETTSKRYARKFSQLISENTRSGRSSERRRMTLRGTYDSTAPTKIQPVSQPDKKEEEKVVSEEQTPSVTLFVSALADYARYTCDLETVDFGEVKIYDRISRHLKITNKGFVTIKYALNHLPSRILSSPETMFHTVTEDSLTNVSRENTNASSLHWTSQQPSPFCLGKSSTGSILPGRTADIEILFIPSSAGAFVETLQLEVDNTKEEEQQTTATNPISSSRSGINLSRSSSGQTSFNNERQTKSYGRMKVTLLGHAEDRAVQLCGLKQSMGPEDPYLFEITAVGLGSKVEKSFSIKNLAKESIRLQLVEDNDLGISRIQYDDVITLSLLSSKIEPGETALVTVTFIGQTVDSLDFNWLLKFPSLDTSLPLRVIGRTREPIAAFDQSHISLATTLLGHWSEAEVVLINGESDMSLDFNIVERSCYSDSISDRLTVSPMNGRLNPGERCVLLIRFCPSEKRSSNFNLVCRLRGRHRPLMLNVKTKSFAIHASAWLEGEAEGQDREVICLMNRCRAPNAAKAALHAARKVLEFAQIRARLEELNFGDMSPGSEIIRHLKLVNHGEMEINFSTLIHPMQRNQISKPTSRNVEQLCKITRLVETLSKMVAVDPVAGVISAGSSVRIALKFTPSASANVLKSILLDGNLLLSIAVQNGPAFVFHLTGSSVPPPVQLSTTCLDFGCQFLDRVGLEPSTLHLGIQNASKTKPFSISCPTRNQMSFQCVFESCILEPGCEVVASVKFTPSESQTYHDKLNFLINGISTHVVELVGKGTTPIFKIEPGALLLYLQSAFLDKKPVRVQIESECEIKVTKSGPKQVFLGNLQSNQITRRLVSVINISPVAIKLMGVSLLPSSPDLNEIRVNIGSCVKELNSVSSEVNVIKLALIAPSKLATNDKTAMKFKDAPYAYIAPGGGCAQIEVTFRPTNVIKAFNEQVFIGVANITASELDGHIRPSRSNYVWLPVFTISGSCAAVNLILESSMICFGAIVEGNSLEKTLILTNKGDLGTRFCWDETTYDDELNISPKEGYVHPRSSVHFRVTLTPKSLTNDIRYETVACRLDSPLKPLHLTVTGFCVPPIPHKEVINFSCPVRETDNKTLTILNPTKEMWILRPVVKGDQFYPSSTATFEVPPQEVGYFEVTYAPLSMTLEGDPKHEGSVFVPLPDGQGFVYSLLGTAEAPRSMGKFQVEITSKTNHQEKQLVVKNWLSRVQRFHVTREFLKQERPDYVFSGLDYIDVPGNSQQVYVLNCFANREANTLVKMTFTNLETGEYQFAELQFRAVRPKSLSVIRLCAPVRRSIHHRLELRNPLTTLTTVTFQSTLQELVCPPQFDLPANSQTMVNLEFAPFRLGEHKGRLEVSSPELGLMIYDLEMEATSPYPEPCVNFTAHLGQNDFQMVHFQNLSRSKAEFICKINNAEFTCEKSITVASNMEGSLGVIFEPSSVGTGPIQGTLTISNPQAGHFIFPLEGISHCPVPQGPILVRHKETASITFKNIFPVYTEFKMHVDNPAFTVGQLKKVVRPQVKFLIPILLEPTTSTSPEGSDQNLSTVYGRLTITCAKAMPTSAETSKRSHPLLNKTTQQIHPHDTKFELPTHLEWVFYLRGVFGASE